MTIKRQNIKKSLVNEDELGSDFASSRYISVLFYIRRQLKNIVAPGDFARLSTEVDRFFHARLSPTDIEDAYINYPRKIAVTFICLKEILGECTQISKSNRKNQSTTQKMTKINSEKAQVFLSHEHESIYQSDDDIDTNHTQEWINPENSNKTDIIVQEVTRNLRDKVDMEDLMNDEYGNSEYSNDECSVQELSSDEIDYSDQEDIYPV
jgi:hypothetical protein